VNHVVLYIPVVNSTVELSMVKTVHLISNKGLDTIS